MKTTPKPSYFRHWLGPWRLYGGRWSRGFSCSTPECDIRHRWRGPLVVKE